MSEGAVYEVPVTTYRFVRQVKHQLHVCARVLLQCVLDIQQYTIMYCCTTALSKCATFHIHAFS